MWPLLLIVCVAAASAGQNLPAGTDAQKFEAAREFVRGRNARDYAINTPNGIDEAKYVEVGGASSGSRFVEKTGTTRCCSFFTADRATRPTPGATPGSGCG